MAGTTRKRRWADLTFSEKLGYIWVLFFLILILGTALAILGPSIFGWEGAGYRPPEGVKPDRVALSPVLPVERFHGTCAIDRGAFEARGLPGQAFRS